MRRIAAVILGLFSFAYLGDWGRRLAVEVGMEVSPLLGATFAGVALVSAAMAGTLMVPGPPLPTDDISPVFRRRLVVVAAAAGPILTAVALSDRDRTSWFAVLVAAAILAALELVYLLRLFERRGQLERLSQRDELTGLANRR